MSTDSTAQGRAPLWEQLRWFVNLRWIAAVAVIGGALVERQFLHWYADDHPLMAVGLLILAYNAGLFVFIRRLEVRWAHAAAARRPRTAQRPVLLGLACIQILLDLGCLSLLAVWTGGTVSPLLGFFVFHMVFASILLPRVMAYGAACAATAMFAGGLWLMHQWPDERGQKLIAIGWAVTLSFTVLLANRITDRLRRQRRRLARQNRRIRRISRRLRQQQEALVQQEKMAALGQMAAGVAHEIANPLASMDSLLQLMQRQPQRDRPEAVSTLRNQVERINQIVQQMTAFAHPDQGDWQVVPLNDAVENALQVLAFDPRLRRVRLVKDLSPRTGMLRLMPRAVQQVLVNLVVNSLDAMADSPQATLTVRTWRDAEGCAIQIADTGHGIAPEHHARLFEPFFTTKPVGKGTGLGLAISYSLIRRHGGRIEVHSQPGQGSTFTIHLPLNAQGPKDRAATGTVIPVSENPKA